MALAKWNLSEKYQKTCRIDGSFENAWKTQALERAGQQAARLIPARGESEQHCTTMMNSQPKASSTQRYTVRTQRPPPPHRVADWSRAGTRKRGEETSGSFSLHSRNQEPETILPPRPLMKGLNKPKGYCVLSWRGNDRNSNKSQNVLQGSGKLLALQVHFCLEW